MIRNTGVLSTGAAGEGGGPGGSPPAGIARDGGRLRKALRDRHPPATMALIVVLLSLSLADGLLTLSMVGAGFVEINPAMVYLMDRGPVDFLLGKYCLTAAGLPVVLALKDERMFGTRFRVGYVLPVFVGLYLALLAYQFGLLILHAEASRRPRPAASASRLPGGDRPGRPR